MVDATHPEHESDDEYSEPEGLDALLLDNPDMEQLLEGQKVLQSQLTEMRAEMTGLRKDLTQLMEIRQTLEVANQEFNRLGDLHWQQHIVEPMVRQLFPIFDLAIGLRSAQRSEGGRDLEAMKAVQSMLQEFLGTHGIELIRPVRGKPFDPAAMQAIRVIPTTDRQQDKCVLACLQAGFRWSQGAAIRPASVQVSRWQPQEDAASTPTQS